jgi:hypothetical protein
LPNHIRAGWWLELELIGGRGGTHIDLGESYF